MADHHNEDNTEIFDYQGEEGEENSSGENDVDAIFSKLRALPVATERPDLLEVCRPIVELWHSTFESPPSEKSSSRVWKGIRRNLPKELNESAFIIVEMMEFVERYEGNMPITVLDMCSGVGYLSMLLSHLLDPPKVSRIVPIDVKFRSHNDLRTDPHSETGHLSTDHFHSAIHPIPIKPRRANIKSSRELKQIKEHCIDPAPGPVVILGVHLCKALSVHTVRLFNMTQSKRLYLKPCCLPGRKELRRKDPPFWTFEHMPGTGFGIQDLYCTDCNAASAKKEARTMKQESRTEAMNQTGTQNKFFSKWVCLLRDAADIDNVSVEIVHCKVQAKYFQNQYVVATR